MKNLYKILFTEKFFILLFIMFSYNKVNSQQYITWTAVSGGNSIGGAFGGSNTVTGTLIGGINNVVFDSPALNQGNLIVTGASTFSTLGPNQNDPSDNLTFTFSVPVFITRYNMADIDQSIGTWDDSFGFAGVNFTNNPSPTSTNCTATLGGVIATVNNGGFASWFCSNAAVNNFSINYAATGGATHAALHYSIQVLVPPTIDPICLNDIPIDLNTIIVGNTIIGTWNPLTIDTSISGSFIYTFTPNTGQAIQCPIPVTVTILPSNAPGCCQNDLNLINPLNNVNNLSMPIIGIRHREAINSIIASNIVSIGDNAANNGVVYHAGNFVDLMPGFDAINGSQFVAYPEGCSNNYVYRNQNSSISNQLTLNNSTSRKVSNDVLLYPNPSNSIINIVAVDKNIISLVITSLESRVVLNKTVGTSSCEIDVSSFLNGIYLITIQTNDGKTIVKKFIKN